MIEVREVIAALIALKQCNMRDGGARVDVSEARPDRLFPGYGDKPWRLRL